ncbi:unnamed protein product [Alopecurus aequalis]
MGNEMGNNNVIGQQVSEESAKDFEKTMHHSDCSPWLNNINDEEKEDKKDVDMEVLKAPLISNGGDEKMASDQTKIPAANEDIDENNRGSLQDHASTQENHGNSNLHAEEGDETQEDNETKMTTNSTETAAPVGSTIEDMTRNKDTSSSDEQFKELAHKITEETEDSTLVNPHKLLEEKFEGLPEDEKESCNQEVEAVVGNLVGERTVENLEEGQTQVSTVCDLSTPPSVQGEATSSTALILTDCHDTEIKDVVVLDEPRERGNPSYVQPKYDTNQETSKNEENQEICEMGKSKSCKTTEIDTVIESDHEVLEKDKTINPEEDYPNCTAYAAHDNDEAVYQFQSTLAVSSATDGKEFQKHEMSIAAAGEMSDSGSAAMEHNVIERTDKEEGVTVDKDVADKKEIDNFEGDNKSDGIHDLASIAKVHGEDFTGLDPSLSCPLPILNEEEVQEEVIIEELAAPMTATSSALQQVEDSVKEDTKPASTDTNEVTTTFTYEANTVDTQETTKNIQCGQPRQVLLEEPEVVKFENSETLTTCMQLVAHSSATELVFPNVFHKKREGASDKAASFTSESGEQKVTGVVGFSAESNQKKVIGKFSEEQCLLQEPTLGRDAGEETPLLLGAESTDSSSYSSAHHIKVGKDIPMTTIVLMQAKHEAVDESEKSPLLSPREPSEGAFRAPNHSVRKDKPLHILMTEDRVGRWSSLKEEEPARKNSTTVSSPRSKEKQKPKSSLFSICMCCTTATN